MNTAVETIEANTTLYTAAVRLSNFLSVVFKTEINVPHKLADRRRDDEISCCLSGLMSYLPKVQQRDKNGRGEDFNLTMVFRGQGTSINESVAYALNAVLIDIAENEGDHTAFTVPTFFYPDGSCMTIEFDTYDLARAILVIARSHTVAAFLDGLTDLHRQADKAKQADRAYFDRRGGHGHA